MEPRYTKSYGKARVKSAVRHIKITFAAAFILCGFAFGDTIYLKNGGSVANAAVTEVTVTDVKYRIGKRTAVYTVLKNDVLRIAYDDGGEDVFGEEAAPPPEVGPLEAEPSEAEPLEAASEQAAGDRVIKASSFLSGGYLLRGLEASYVFRERIAFQNSGGAFLRHGFGVGLVLGPDIYVPVFYNAYLGLPKGENEYFMNNRLGIIAGDGYIDGVGLMYEPSFGVQAYNTSLSLGYSFSSENSWVIRVGYRFDDEKDVDRTPKKKSPRYIRPGIEINYPVWRDSVEFFENEFPYLALGVGLFFRIGPEKVYFTTGAYAKVEGYERYETKDLSAFGLHLATIPLLDITWGRVALEIPALVSFGSGQIRFSTGALFDSYVVSEFSVSESVFGTKISVNDADKIEERLENAPVGDMWWVFGLDFDIVRYWGIGVKFLIHCDSFGSEEYSLSSDKDVFKPGAFQTRISTYFVF